MRRTSLGLLVAVTAIWGLTFVMVQDAVRATPVLSFLAWRFLIAGLVMSLLTTKTWRQMTWGALAYGLLLGGLVAAGYWLQTFGLKATTVDLAGFLTGLAVVLTPVLAFVLWRRPTPPLVWVCAAAALGGLWLLAGSRGALSVGDWLVVGGAGAFALQLLATDVAVRRHPLSVLVAVELLTTGAISLAGAEVTGGLVWPMGSVVWTALMVTALLASVAAFWAQGHAQQYATPQETATVLAAEPLFAALFSYVLQGAALVGWQWAGAGLITGSIAALARVAPGDEGPPGLGTVISTADPHD